MRVDPPAGAGGPEVMLAADAASTAFGRRDAVRVGVASGFAAVVSYVVLALVARVLPVEQNTVFVTYWSTLFACFGVLTGISVETTRAVAATGATPTGGAPATARGPRVVTVAVIAAGGGVLLALLVLTVAGRRLFHQEPWPLTLLVLLGAAGFAIHTVAAGSLAGRQAWRPYALLVSAEAAARLVLVALAVVLSAGLLGVAAGAAVATFAWVALLGSRQVRAALAARTDALPALLARRVLLAAVAAGSSSVLVVGFPLLLAATTSAVAYERAAPLLLAISLTRAPLLVPLNAYQGVAVGHFVRSSDAGLRPLVPIVRAVAVVGALGAVAAWLVGPWLMELLLGPGYRVDGGVLAGLTAAAAVLAVLTLTGALCQALTRHTAYVVGWLVAVAVAVAVLLGPWDIETRAVAALLAGPAVGAVVHLVVLRRATAGRGPRRDLEAA